MKTSTTFKPRIAHVKILRALYRFRLLTTDLVVRAVGSVSSASTVRQNILELVEQRYIDRFELATTGGRSPYICVLAEKGSNYLAEEFGYNTRSYKPPSYWKEKSHTTLLHPLELNKFVIAAHKITEYDQRVKLSGFDLDYEIKLNPPLRAREPFTGIEHIVEPDAVLQFQVQFPDELKRRIILVELERKTHKSDAFADKIQGLFFFAALEFEHRYNHPLPRIALVSSISDTHVQTMKEQTEATIKNAYPQLRIKKGDGIMKPSSAYNVMFHLGRMPALQNGDIDVPNTFLAPSWQHPIDTDLPQLYTLLGL